MHRLLLRSIEVFCLRVEKCSSICHELVRILQVRFVHLHGISLSQSLILILEEF